MKTEPARNTSSLLPFAFLLLPSTDALPHGRATLPLLDAGLQLALERDGLLVVRVYLHGALCVGCGLRAVAAFEEDAAEEDVRVNQLAVGVPEDRGLELVDCRGQLAAALVDAPGEQVGLGVHRLDADYVAQLGQGLVVSARRVEFARLGEQVLCARPRRGLVYLRVLVVPPVDVVGDVEVAAHVNGEERGGLRLLP